MDDKRAAAQRFLQIVLEQTNRLNAILEDVLSLARIEKDSQKKQLVLEEAPIREILDAALTTCAARADGRRIRLICDCPAEITAKVHCGLLEQAVVNLVDNAIKYSEPGNEVRVEAVQDESGTGITVIDHGCGIEARHLHRLFERFYRVDTARSRATGGTGLGLAIVQAHCPGPWRLGQRAEQDRPGKPL